jgi:hypothetical protein
MDECQMENNTKTYLGTKMMIKTAHEQLVTTKDLPTGHVFGKEHFDKEHNMKQLMQCEYQGRNQ